MKAIAARFFFQAEDGIRDDLVTGVQTCALPIFKKTAAPTEILRVLAEAGVERGVFKCGSTEIMIEGRSVACEIRFHNIEIAVEIVIGGGYPHTSLRFAVGAEGAARFHGDVGKFSVF